jgi:hypothetical protein
MATASTCSTEIDSSLPLMAAGTATYHLDRHPAHPLTLLTPHSLKPSTPRWPVPAATQCQPVLLRRQDAPYLFSCHTPLQVQLQRALAAAAAAAGAGSTSGARPSSFMQRRKGPKMLSRLL